MYQPTPHDDDDVPDDDDDDVPDDDGDDVLDDDDEDEGEDEDDVAKKRFDLINLEYTVKSVLVLFLV